MALATVSYGIMMFYRLFWPLLALISMTSASRELSARVGVYLGLAQDMYIRLSHHVAKTYILYINKPQIPFNTHCLSRPFAFTQLILH